MADYGFGVDLGGTTCKLGLFTTDGMLVEKWEIKTNTADQGSHILSDISEAIFNKMKQQQITASQVVGIGFGVPGPVLKNGIVNKAINLGWGVFPLEEEMSKLMGMKIKVANDANAAALGEFWMGSGSGCDSLVMVTLGTGVGGGVVMDGKIVSGHLGAAGEIGHIIIHPTEKEACNCGHHGCMEQYISAKGIARIGRKYLQKSDQPSKLRKIPELSAKNIFAAAKAEDKLALEIVDDVCKQLGSSLAILANVINPEAIVIGGGVSRAGDILIQHSMTSFENNVFHACRDTKIYLSKLGNDAGIYGCMRLVME